ncbi:hypothetical protein HMPREF9318_00376 [Streptococcus urinalis FB127-CNA-2]|uniref:ABC-type quaternary amine transporter n=1 Tax=Streptococcus urinalis 2285-97 TaxID=764291 RepID=G5KFW8_9STRE|nr:ABC transporter ATP-binding protein [Streptococcus urinalis]EHJ56507.1 TOBE domain protein [Streptococcus urinalis 2285-97]EKS22178.1 hypothetical protein HMPREF9318_00376 [Streptococcus urinalis FB127-CNA-2]VEF31990.1 ferric cations import ATP-binding protein FbpC [Streptococcus urinalis]
MSIVELNDIRVSYDKQNDILKNLSLSIKNGELVSLLGPSGCGKTTTLRVLAGLIKPNDGQVIVNNEDITKVPVHKRHFGMVFQSYALFPHMTIYDNIAFGLKRLKLTNDQIEKKIKEIVKICGLEGFEKRLPKQLSGGQRQRVALARALVIEPKVLLLDEPLSNLDAKLRLAMRLEIRRIQQELNMTTLFVTHDQEECFSISDKVAIMNEGVIEQFDTPENIYRRPITKFVAEFIGFENFIPITKNQNTLVYTDKSGSHYDFLIENKTNSTNGLLTIRPEDIIINRGGEIDSVNQKVGKIRVRTFLGKQYQYEVKTDIGSILVTSDDSQKFEVSQEVTLTFKKEKLVFLVK